MAPPHQSSLFLFLLLLSLPTHIRSQQPYTGQSFSNCALTDNSTSLFGYSCNGRSRSCSAFLSFHARSPYLTVSTISTLLRSAPSALASSNSVPQGATFPVDTKVVVPVDCSCSGGHYQLNTTYLVKPGDGLFLIANVTFQGLSTCHAIAAQNKIPPPDFPIKAGDSIVVPLRCACPTADQISGGARYLLSYLVVEGDEVGKIGERFGVGTEEILSANGLSPKTTIVPFTTLLIPLSNEPSPSQLSAPPSSDPPPPTSVSRPRKKSRKGVYIGAGAAVAAVLLSGFAIAVCCVACFRGKKTKEKEAVLEDDAKMLDKSTGESSGVPEELLLGISGIERALKEYKYVELQRATNSFSAECLIDESVYRGVFHGDSAAIKMMNRDVSKEIDILKRVNHSNLIGLSGVCFHEGRWYLVYEYAENGSLGDWLFDKSGSKVLSWIQRVQIAQDVANGLSYLHNYTMPSYVHKDIKCSNILLDGNFKAKIANFGLARPTEGDEDEPVLTRHIIGTQRYMAPEYLEHGLITPKLDIYAFGVVMMEIITGKEVVLKRREGEAFTREELVAIFSKENTNDDLGACIDPSLEGNYSLLAASSMARLTAECLKPDAGSRPSTVELLQSLSGIVATSMNWYFANGVSGSQSFSSEGEMQPRYGASRSVSTR